MSFLSVMVIDYGRGDPLKLLANKGVRAFLFFMIAGTLTCAGLLMSFSFSNESELIIHPSQKEDYLQIYLLDEDHLLVPLAIAQEQDLDRERQIEVMVEYLCGKQELKGFSSFFTQSDILDQVEVVQGSAILNFNDRFLSYESEEELHLVEALVWGCTQFQDIEEVILQLNGEPLTVMPLAQTPLVQPLTRSIGINHFESSNGSLHDSVSLLVYGTKNIKGTHYLIPRSRRVSKDVVSSLDDQLSAVMADLSATGTLSSTMEEHAITLANDDGILDLTLDQSLLNSDRSLKQDDVNELILSLCSLSDIEGIRLHCGEDASGCENGTILTMEELLYNIIEPS